MANFEELRQTALQAAHIGGEILLGFRDRIPVGSIQAKGSADFVSEADLSSERAIVEFLMQRHPDHTVLTEEAGSVNHKPDAPHRWIIDPLDGTTNFLCGMPVWAVSVAVEKRNNAASNRHGAIVAGAVVVPPLGLEYSAALGGGAFKGDASIKPNSPRAFTQSLIGTGFPFRSPDLVDAYLKIFSDMFGRIGDMRRAGAVAVDLCWTAEGVFDGFWEFDLAPWDVAAGSLIITEAGGKVGDMQGGVSWLRTGDIVAGNPATFDRLLEVTSRHFPKQRGINKLP